MVCIAKYCDAHEALLNLQGVEVSDFIWRKLEDKDIHCMEDPEKIGKDKDCWEVQQEREAAKTHLGQKWKKTKDQPTAMGGPGVGEGRRIISWLFVDSGTGEGSVAGVYEGTVIFFGLN